MREIKIRRKGRNSSSHRPAKQKQIKFNLPPSAPGIIHLFKTADGKEKEWVWNKDAPYPIIILLSKSGKMMSHTGTWKPKPFWKPKPGRRYFTKLRKKRCMFLAKRTIRKIWKKNPNNYWRAQGLDREQAAFMLSKTLYAKGHASTLLEIGKSKIRYVPNYKPLYRKVSHEPIKGRT